jgi:DNA invertase Pin-like site-specific DNA recombinase
LEGKRMKIGYARVSSVGQSLDVQLAALGEAGCDRIYQEKASAKSTDGRPELEHALDLLREGDELVVTRLDRLARSVPDLYAIVDRIDRAGAGFHCLQQSIETKTATGKLILGVLGAVAQFERELTKERQAEGIARAKANGVYRKKRGRKDLVDRDAVLKAYAEHGTYGKAARALTEAGIRCSKSTVERIVQNKPSRGRSAPCNTATNNRSTDQ